MDSSAKNDRVLFDISGAFALQELPPFLRVLLTTDGTVTKSLEAFFWERVKVNTTSQSTVVLTEDHPSLNCVAGDTVVSREVALRGLHSGRTYATAESLIRYDLLPENFRRDLNDQKLGVGELLRECGLETYREILSLGENDRGRSVWRVYRIVMGKQPFIQIKETFPLHLY